jgi:nucleoside-diphosphate-sugar epimerase
MNNILVNDSNRQDLTLVLGGTGKTGRRVLERLRSRGINTRSASRSASPSFDWNDGVKRALGREPRDFADYAREAAASGIWRVVNEEALA